MHTIDIVFLSFVDFSIFLCYTKVVRLVHMVMFATKIVQETVDQTVKHVTLTQEAVGMDVKLGGKEISAMNVRMCMERNNLQRN